LLKLIITETAIENTSPNVTTATTTISTSRSSVGATRATKCGHCAVVMQIVHAAVRIVRSNPITTATQVFSRVFLIWGVLWLVPEVCITLFSSHRNSLDLVPR